MRDCVRAIVGQRGECVLVESFQRPKFPLNENKNGEKKFSSLFPKRDKNLACASGGRRGGSGGREKGAVSIRHPPFRQNQNGKRAVQISDTLLGGAQMISDTLLVGAQMSRG